MFTVYNRKSQCETDTLRAETCTCNIYWRLYDRDIMDMYAKSETLFVADLIYLS